jgi:hypothetical protein
MEISAREVRGIVFVEDIGFFCGFTVRYLFYTTNIRRVMTYKLRIGKDLKENVSNHYRISE